MSAEGNLGSEYGRVVELVDSLDSGSSVHCGRAGSSPASPTMKKHASACFFRFSFLVRKKIPPFIGIPRCVLCHIIPSFPLDHQLGKDGFSIMGY